MMPWSFSGNKNDLPAGWRPPCTSWFRPSTRPSSGPIPSTTTTNSTKKLGGKLSKNLFGQWLFWHLPVRHLQILQQKIKMLQAVCVQIYARCFGSLKKWKKIYHRVVWYHQKEHISGFQMSPKSKSCTFHNSNNLPSNICLQVHYYLHNRGSFWRGFLQPFVAQPGLYICRDSLEQS